MMIHEFLLVKVLLVFIVLFVGLYFYFTRNFKFWKKYKIPFIKPVPFFGNFKDVIFQKVDIGHHLKNMYDKNKDKPYVGLFAFHLPALLICDLELVKNILVRDSNNFTDRILSINEKVDPMGGKNLFSLKGQKWKYMRSNFTPTFTSVKMKKMFNLVNNCGKELVNCLVRTSENGCPIHVKDTMARFTIDVIASCAFGIEVNSLKNPNAEFRQVMSTVFQFSLYKALAGFMSFFAPELGNILKMRLIDEHITTFVRGTLWSSIEHRKKNGVKRKDFVDGIMQLLHENGIEKSGSNDIEFNGTKLKIDGDDFVAQAYIFLAAGFEPASTTMTFALYELSFRPEIQTRLRKEITKVLEKYNEEVTYEAVQEMTYLDMVVSETLRKYPVVPFLDRVPEHDYSLPAISGNEKVTLKAGTGVYISVLAIHNDPVYYPEPKRFDPERFTNENKARRHKYSYIPFGEGGRTCIGMRFGLMSVKTGLIHILNQFEVEPCKDTPTSLIFDPKPFLLGTEGEIPLSFKKIRD